MKHFGIRFPGGLTWSAPWPDPAPALQVLDLPTRLRVPLISSSHKPQSPLPQTKPPGTLVGQGELLTLEEIESGPAAIAPTSGRIVGQSRVTLTNNRECPAIDIEPDFQDRAARSESHDPSHAQEHQDLMESLAKIDRSQLPVWIERLRRNGVYADRISSPDLLAQLRMALENPVQTLLCSLLDDDPPLRLSAILGARSAPTLVEGLRVLSRITGAKRTVLLVEAGAPGRWWAPLERLTRKAGFILAQSPHRYPQAHPTLLLYNLLDRKLRPSRLPTEAGVLQVDTTAAIAVGRCAGREQPMYQSPIAIRDLGNHKSHYVVAPIGMSIRQVLAQVGIDTDFIELRGGAALRESQIHLDSVVSGAELNLHVIHRPISVVPDPCIRCGWCAESCPTRIQPAGLLEAAQRDDRPLGERYGLEACIECGVCTHVCPARLPLLGSIRKLKH